MQSHFLLPLYGPPLYFQSFFIPNEVKGACVASDAYAGHGRFALEMGPQRNRFDGSQEMRDKQVDRT